MAKTFDMQFIRYMNLFTKVTRVESKHCFAYNNMLVFSVDARDVERALGRNNENLKRLSDILGKRTRVVGEPMGMKDLNKFVKIIVYPIEFEKVEIIDNPETKEKEAIVSSSGRESKAMLIGRDRLREKELREILEQYFEVKTIRIN